MNGLAQYLKNGSDGNFIPRAIWDSVNTPEELEVFIESHGDSPVMRYGNNKGCSYRFETAGGFSIAANGHIHRTA
jgi:hypothetical protein